jgi:hypothetical protein
MKIPNSFRHMQKVENYQNTIWSLKETQGRKCLPLKEWTIWAKVTFNLFSRMKIVLQLPK